MTFTLLLLTGGCGPLEPNNPLYVDDTFDSQEADSIMRAIETWNAVGQEYVGENLIDYKGRFHDQDGFDQNRNLNDGISVLYRVSDQATYNKLTRYLDGHIGGMRIGEDMVLFVEILSLDGEEVYQEAIQYTALHEMGHWLGLPDERSKFHKDCVMYWAHSEGQKFNLTPSQHDIDNLCQIYDCIK